MNVRDERFPYFDSLRALAALSVLGSHAALHAGDTWALPFAARLESGIAIFFLISGFLLYRPFVRARLLDQEPPRGVAYAWRRALRIVPAYWVALTLITIWISLPGGVFTWDRGPLYYGFAQTWSQRTIGGGLSQAWTLCIEVTFYAFLPLWSIAMRRLFPGRGAPFAKRVRVELVALAGLFAFSIVWKLALLAGSDPDRVVITPALDSLPSFLDHFALGMALAVMSVWLAQRGERALPRPLALLQRAPWLPWGFAAAAFAVAAWGIGLSGHLLERFTPAQYLERHLLYAAIGLGVLVPAVLGARGVIGWLLGSRVLMWLGLISYSIYLWSAAVLTQLERRDVVPTTSVPLAYFEWALVAALATIPVAALSYYLVERPALSLRRLIPMRGAVAPGEAPTEPAPATPPVAEKT